MGQKSTKTTRTTVEDLGTAWIIEHPYWWLGVAFGVGLVCGVVLMELQLAHAGLL